MKKIICLLLLITCSFALFACGNETPDPNEGDNPPAVELPDAEFFDTVANSDPNKITTVTNTTDKATGKTYNGLYESFIAEDGSVRHVYKYEVAKKATLENLGNPGATEEKTGEVLYNGGLYSVDGGENWIAGELDAKIVNVKFDLNREYIGEYKMSKDGKTLTATVSAENAKKILGLDEINAKGDVTIKVVTNGTYLAKVIVDYANAKASEHIETSYTYVPVEETPAE